MIFKSNRSIAKKIKGLVEGYSFDGGILNDKDYKLPKFTSLTETPELKTFAGGPARKITNEKSGKSIGEVFVENMQRLNVNLLTDPFKSKSNQDILKFTDEYLKQVFSAKNKMRRVENLLQAVIRNPILRGDYGGNSASTADSKGFDRLLIDTAQTFKAIKVEAKKNV